VKAGWRVVPLGEVCSVVNGGTPKSSVASYWGGDVNWLTPKDMGQMTGRHIAETPRKITANGLDNCSARLVPAGSVIMSTRAPIGHLAINDAPMAFNQGCRGMIPEANLDPVFLFHFLSANTEALNKLGTGTTFKELSATALRAFPIPLPPLDEQRQIVAVLDEAFERLSRARANAEANLADARELFVVALKQIFSIATGMPKGSVVQLGSTFKTATGSTPPKSDARNYGTFLPFVKPPELTDGEVFEAPDNLSAEGAALARVFPAGSVLISCIGNLGKVGLATRTLTCNQQINVISPNTAVALPEFMFFQALSPQFRGQLSAASSGTTVPIVNKSKFNAIEIVVPPLDTQREIAEKLATIQSESRSVATDYQTKAAAIDWLRQSLLQKAFSGELT